MSKKRILVVIDCQNDFITGSLKNEDAIKAIPNVVKKIREFDGDAIFYTLDTHEENYLETNEGKKLPVVHCIYGTEGWKLEPNVEAAINDRRMKMHVQNIEKPTFGSFKLVDAIAGIVGNEQVEIEIIGFVTSICVISNALILKAAFYNTGEISIDEKCCAGIAHNEAITVAKCCQINV